MAVVVSVRLVWRTARTCVVAPAAGAFWLADKVVAWAEARFDNRDPFADVDHVKQQAPEPVPASQVALPTPTVPPAPLSLPPDEALRALHTQYPDLPCTHVRWHLADDGVLGEVNALDADEAGQRRIVETYAVVLSAPVTETVAGAHVTVAVMGAFADVTVTVAAVLIHDDTVPLPMYREAAGTLTTQAIPDDVLRGVIAA